MFSLDYVWLQGHWGYTHRDQGRPHIQIDSVPHLVSSPVQLVSENALSIHHALPVGYSCHESCFPRLLLIEASA
jgi:hypothetical protein